MRASLKTLVGKRNLIGCEIGIDDGANAQSIFVNLDINTLYLIDPYEHNPNAKKTARKYLAKHQHQIVWVQKKSWDVKLNEIPNDSLDFVYIDGDHSYEAVRKDLQRYWFRVKAGGLLAGHDYGQQNGVKKAVDEFFKDRTISIDWPDMDWWTWR